MAKTKEQEAVDEVMFQEAISQQELDLLYDENTRLISLKRKLPMLYTARGNVIKRGSLRVTGKNFNQVTHMIEQINFMHGLPIVVSGDGWSLTLDVTLSDELRACKQVGYLILSGWQLTV